MLLPDAARARSWTRMRSSVPGRRQARKLLRRGEKRAWQASCGINLFKRDDRPAHVDRNGIVLRCPVIRGEPTAGCQAWIVGHRGIAAVRSVKRFPVGRVPRIRPDGSGDDTVSVRVASIGVIERQQQAPEKYGHDKARGKGGRPPDHAELPVNLALSPWLDAPSLMTGSS